MVTTEEVTSHDDISPTSGEGGELLQYASNQAKQSIEVTDEVDKTQAAIIQGLLPWDYFIPANEVERLIAKRGGPANDNSELEKAA